MSQNSKVFSGYQWHYYPSLQAGHYRSRADGFLASVNWPALLEYAAEKRNGVNCVLLPDIGLGLNNMVRILEFADGLRWVARLRMPPLAESTSCEDTPNTKMNREFHAISLVQQKTRVPVPQIYALESGGDCSVRAPFMLMDCLEGNVGMDLGKEIPPESKQTALSNLAKIHVQLSEVQLPMIGTILSINTDGSYQQGPIPGLGGPFNTATQFFEAWAAKVKFGMPHERLRVACGQYATEIIHSVETFPKSISNLANRLSLRDHGPFPLCHGDFGHNNIIVDDQYQTLGVIDWESAFAGPWEVFGDFPLTLSVVPRAMDAPWTYDDEGRPNDAHMAQKLSDQKDYISAVRYHENERNGNSHSLSETLEDSKRQNLVAAMRLYESGKAGWYAKLADDFFHLDMR